MRKLTLSTAVKAPNVLLMFSMTIWGSAIGSSQGRSAVFFCCAEIIRLEVGRRRRRTARRQKESPLDNPRLRHAPLPSKFAIQVNLHPHRRSQREMGRSDHSKSNVALASRRPYCRGHVADFALARALGIHERIMRRFVAGDVEAHELAARAALPLGEQGAPAGKVTLVEVHEPSEAEFERRAVAARANGLFRGEKIDMWADESGLDTCNIERL